jgi:hypothetical protein
MRSTLVFAAAGGVAAATAFAALAQPVADPSAPANPAVHSSSDMTSQALAPGHNSFTRSQAASRIASAGYTNVANLVLDGQGLWQATAMRDGQSVHVALDYKGNVAAQ